MKRQFYFILLVLTLASCKPKEKIIYLTRIERHDSIVTNTVRDTVLKYPKQKQSVVTPKKSHLQTDLAVSDAEIDSSGLLHHSIQNKGLIPSKVSEQKTKVHDSIRVPYPVEVPKYYRITETKTKKVNVYGFFWWVGLYFCIRVAYKIIINLNNKFNLWQKLTKGFKN